jgi:hypothetical protein
MVLMRSNFKGTRPPQKRPSAPAVSIVDDTDPEGTTVYEVFLSAVDSVCIGRVHIGFSAAFNKARW